MDSITLKQDTKLVLIEAQPIDQNPAAVYLARMGNKRSSDVQRQGLEVIANMLTGKP